MSSARMRKRTSSASSADTAHNLPPPRTSNPIKPVTPPLSSTRLHKLIYILITLTAILGAYYSYRMLQWKSEVGGWWNLALGKRPPQLKTQGARWAAHTERRQPFGRCDKGHESVEDRINALAEALGMPSRDLASAIAGAVREYVPPASLSSVAAQETGPAVEALIKGGGEHKATGTDGPGVVGSVVSGMENFVGMDEP